MTAGVPRPPGGRFAGKVVLITGAARGQGRSHAVRFAQEGADIIAVDVCEQIPTSPVAMGSEEDLKQTRDLVEALDRRIHTHRADVRDLDELQSAVDTGLEMFGKIDVVLANAGVIQRFGSLWEISAQDWADTVATNLTGVFHTLKAAVPSMIERGEGGSVVLTSSSAGLKAYANCAAYVSSKHGLTGLTRAAALELAPHKIRVNAICPSNVSTPMFQNDVIKTLFAPGQDLSDDEWAAAVTPMNLLEVPWVESDDITNAAMYLCGDEGRYLTGVTLPVDAGLLVK